MHPRPDSETDESRNANRSLEALRSCLLDWWSAVEGAAFEAMRRGHPVEVTLYDLAVLHFGIRRDFLEWRPKLSGKQAEVTVQGQARRDRPEWQVRVVTARGRSWVKLSDGRIFRPRSEVSNGYAKLGKRIFSKSPGGAP